MQEDDFLIYIENFIPKIKYIRFIFDIEARSAEESYKFLRALIYFIDQDSADNFYYDYNTKSYPINKFEFVYCMFVERIYFEETSMCLNSQNINKLYIPLIFDPYKEQSEIFCCPLCLEKLDSASSGIHTMANLANSERWEPYHQYCKVCSKISQDKVVPCTKCKTAQGGGTWCCMVCGVTGCDRYQAGHAVEHFNSTLHRYSIDLTSQRIWDYLGDTWVHRLIKLDKHTQSTIEFEELQDDKIPNTKEFLTRIENVISEYNYVLGLQLEEQRKYYEKEISKLEDKNENTKKNKIKTLNNIKDEIHKINLQVEANQKLCKESKKKLAQQEKKIREMNESMKLNHDMIENIKEDAEKNEESLAKYEDELEKQYESKKVKKEILEKELSELYSKISG
jgi:BRCA1-associated protein